MERVEKSFERITDEDLTRLAAIAAKDRTAFFFRYPRYKDTKVLCVALCQGAALHYINGENGINDFDVWTFYKGMVAIPNFPCRRRTQYDFGESRFGAHPADDHYVGRHVDVMGRSIYVVAGNPVEALREYLSQGRTNSARCLAQKAVVLLEPAHLRGTVAWPLN